MVLSLSLSEQSTLFACVLANLQSLTEKEIDSKSKSVIIDLLSIFTKLVDGINV